MGFSRFVVFGTGMVLDDLNSWHCFFQDCCREVPKFQNGSKLGNIERFPLEKSTHRSAVSHQPLLPGVLGE